MSNPSPLPLFLRPMLAQAGRPFDSDQHLFENKWDGIRALAFIEQAGYRLVSRHGLELGALFPELAVLGDLPPGTLLDGELVVLRRGKPDLSLVQSRQQLRSGHKIRVRARTIPAAYIVLISCTTSTGRCWGGRFRFAATCCQARLARSVLLAIPTMVAIPTTLEQPPTVAWFSPKE